MNIYGYVEVFIKVNLEGEKKPLYNKLKMDFSKEVTQEFFDGIEEMMHQYYEKRFSKKVLSVESITLDEYQKNEDKDGSQMVVSFNGDNINYKEETPSKNANNYCYIVSYSFFEPARIVGPFSTEEDAFLAMEKEAKEEYRIDIYENKKIASLIVSKDIGKIELCSKPNENCLPEDKTSTIWQVQEMEG